MSGKTTLLLIVGMIAAIVFGGLLGHYAPGLMLAISVIGKLYVNILTILVIILVASAMIVGISNLGHISKLTRSGGKAILYYAVTGFIAVVIGLLVVVVFSPGSGYTIPGAVQSSVDQSARSSYSLSSILLEDQGILGVSRDTYLGFIFLVILFGGAISVAGTGARTVITFFKGVADVIGRLVRIMLLVSPIGLLSLVGTSVAVNDVHFGDIFSGAAGYPLAVVVGLLVYAAVLMPATLKVMGKQSITRYFSNLAPALVAGFGTSSSVVALPFTYEAVVDRNKVDQRAGALVLPLGNVLNFGPTAMVVTIAALFIAQAMGAGLGVGGVILLVLASIATSIGLAGLPGVTGPLLFLLVGLVAPSQGLAIGVTIVVAVDWLIDRLRGAANVCGDAVGAAVIAETFEFKTAARTTVKSVAPRRESRMSRRPREERPEGVEGSAPERRWERRDQPRFDRRDRQPRPIGRGGRPERDMDRRPEREREAPRRQPEQAPSPFRVAGATSPALEVKSPADNRPPRPAEQREAPPRPPRPQREPERQRPPRGERPADTRRERPVDTRGPERDNRLTRDKIEKELARVTAQLRPPESAPGEAGQPPVEQVPVEQTEPERIPEPRETEPSRALTEPVEEETFEPEDILEEEPSGFGIGDESEEAEEYDEEEPRGEEGFETEEPGTGAEAEEPGEVSYGRTKSRHRLEHAKIEEEAATVSGPEEPEVEDSFSNEGISFGRAKRKKTK